ncbi:hypothetical protein EC23916_2091 [Escherichia coli 2.3916]|uniref:hypothetical protein n=1 Tax=Escherichia coli TaxID=562 RepID=UPI00025CA248|nr:hypothetical protein [Escherichia coli]EII45579.1 hypothetical protein EC23916_2091 [Escherichia coli 2.3916]
MSEFAWSWNEPRPAIDPARFTEHRQETETDLQRAIRYYLEADKKGPGRTGSEGGSLFRTIRHG